MTDQPEAIAPHTQLVNEQAADWFDRKHFWVWNETDEVAFNLWLVQSPAHEIAYWRLEAGWARAERMAALKRPLPKRKLPERASSLPIAARVVAGLIVLGWLSFAIFTPASREASYATATGARRTVILGDGSKIELNTNTAIRVQMDVGERRVTLARGEAFFDVKHDASRPFVVTAAGRRVTDIGTKFLLHLVSDNRLEMALTEGKARLDAVTDDAIHREAVLEPGDVAIATSASLSLRKAGALELHRSLAWQHGNLIFNETTLADACAEFNRYNDQKLVVADAATAARKVSGTFRTTNTGDFASLAHDILGLRVQRKGNEIVISQ